MKIPIISIRLVSIVACILLIMLSFLPFGNVMGESPVPVSMVYVDDDFNESTPGWQVDHFDRIQDGIDAVMDKGAVYVFKGLYYDRLMIFHSISLLGEDRNATIIDGSVTRMLSGDENHSVIPSAEPEGDVINILADEVLIHGFTIQHSEFDWGFLEWAAGVHIESDNVVISGNSIIDNMVGVWFDASSNHTLVGNNISRNYYGIKGYSTSGNSVLGNTVLNSEYGIFLDEGAKNSIIGNTLSEGFLGSSYGITFFHIENSTLSGNKVVNPYCGIWLHDSSDNVILENELSGDGVDGEGIMLDSSNNNRVTGNRVSLFRKGIDVASFSNGTLLNRNIIRDNMWEGIAVESTGNIITKNRVGPGNDYGIRLYSSDNLVYHNTFYENRWNGYDNCGNSWDNGYPDGGNYWDDFHNDSQGAYDRYHGEEQSDPGSDAIVDRGPYGPGLNPYMGIGGGGGSEDSYPLRKPLNPFYFPEAVEPVGPGGIGDGGGSLPLVFTENIGQYSEQVEFQAQVPGATIYFCSDQIISLVSEPVDLSEIEDNTPRQRRCISIVTHLINSNTDAFVIGEDPLTYYHNYFIGDDPSAWYTHVPTYRSVRYVNIYPDIDLRYYSCDDSLKYEFIVYPGGDASQIQLRYEGIDHLLMTLDGELRVDTRLGSFFEKQPFIYQEINGERQMIPGSYNIQEPGMYGFNLDSSYDSSQPLIIDPELVYSTFLGGVNSEGGHDILTDENGQVYIVGGTRSLEFPVQTPYDGTYNGHGDVIITKLDPAIGGPESLLYSTFLGGAGSWDEGYGIDLDAEGNIYITGKTMSSNFPTVNPYDPDWNGWADGFVAQLSAAGDVLLYSTYLGGADIEWGVSIAVDDPGNAYITGTTDSTDFPTVNAFNDTYSGANDAFVAKLTPSLGGSESLVYSTYLGGYNWDDGFAIAIDANGSAYVTGETLSSDFPTLNAFDDSLNGETDVFVTKFAPSGDSLIFSTYIGGSDDVVMWPHYYFEAGVDIVVDGRGDAYITGATDSSDFPTVNPYERFHNGGSSDIFILKLSSSGEDLLFSTYLGGAGYDAGVSIADDSLGNSYVTGYTNSLNLPMVDPYDESYNGGDYDAFIARLTASGNDLLFSTYLGGSQYDIAEGIVVDGADDPYVIGLTQSSNFPTANPFDGEYAGEGDIFVSKVSLNTPPDPPQKPSGRRWGFIFRTYTYTTTTMDPNGDDVFFKWDWGDGTYSDWLGPYASGDVVTASHAWAASGFYDVQAQAKDIHGALSDWSPMLIVKITRISLERNNTAIPAD